MKNYSVDELVIMTQRYCAAQEQCVSAARAKMLQWGADRETADMVIDRMIDEGFINERRYVEHYCLGKLHQQHWGRNKIVWGLRSKGIGNELIAEGMACISDEDYFDVLRKVAASKWAALGNGDERRNRYKLTSFLLSRGFESDEIRAVIDSI